MSSESIIQSPPVRYSEQRQISAPVQAPISLPEALLNYLREHSEQVITRQELASGVWGLRLDARSRVIDQTISQARKILKPHERILTVHGFGYRHQRMRASPNPSRNNHPRNGKDRA